MIDYEKQYHFGMLLKSLNGVEHNITSVFIIIIVVLNISISAVTTFLQKKQKLCCSVDK